VQRVFSHDIVNGIVVIDGSTSTIKKLFAGRLSRQGSLESAVMPKKMLRRGYGGAQHCGISTSCNSFHHGQCYPFRSWRVCRHHHTNSSCWVG
jgi:hypothetical protein